MIQRKHIGITAFLIAALIIVLLLSSVLPIRYRYRITYYQNRIDAFAYNDPARAAQLLVFSATSLFGEAVKLHINDPTLSALIAARAEDQITLSLSYVKKIAPEANIEFYDTLLKQLDIQKTMLMSMNNAEIALVAENNQRTLRSYMYQYLVK